MYVAGNPSLRLILLTCLGGSLSTGGAAAINHAVDRDIDRTMARTADRPVASGRVSPAAAIAFGILLGAASFLLMATQINVLAASLSLSGLLGYVFVYTLWLKRRTPQNIVIGGAAGAVPPLVAWAAMTGGLSGMAFYLFAIVFFWTPPHFWALSILMKDDYAAARIPMLPVVAGEDETRRQIMLYTVLLYAVTQLPFCAGGLGDRLPGPLDGPRRPLHRLLLHAAAHQVPRLGAPHLPLLPALPGAALRLDGRRRPRLARLRRSAGPRLAAVLAGQCDADWPSPSTARREGLRPWPGWPAVPSTAAGRLRPVAQTAGNARTAAAKCAPFVDTGRLPNVTGDVTFVRLPQRPEGRVATCAPLWR